MRRTRPHRRNTSSFPATVAGRRPVRFWGQSTPPVDEDDPPTPTTTTTAAPALPNVPAGAVILEPGQLVTTQRAIDAQVAAGRREERQRLLGNGGATEAALAAWDATRTELTNERDEARRERDTLQRIVDEYDRQTESEFAAAITDLPAPLAPFAPPPQASGVAKRLFLVQVAQARAALGTTGPAPTATTTTTPPPALPRDPNPGNPADRRATREVDEVELLAMAVPKRL
jgi:hypothetical protein